MKIKEYQEKYKNSEKIHFNNLNRIKSDHERFVEEEERKEMSSIDSKKMRSEDSLTKSKSILDRGLRTYEEMEAKIEKQKKEVALLKEFKKTNTQTQQDFLNALQVLDNQIVELNKETPVTGIVEAFIQPEKNRKALEELRCSKKNIEEAISKLKSLEKLGELKKDILLNEKKLENLNQTKNQNKINYGNCLYEYNLVANEQQKISQAMKQNHENILARAKKATDENYTLQIAEIKKDFLLFLNWFR